MYFLPIFFIVSLSTPTSAFTPKKQNRQDSSKSVDCGRPATGYEPTFRKIQRIVGGTEAKPHSWPWMSTLSIDLRNGFSGLCGSNLLRVRENADESDILLTAAHCVVKEETLETTPVAYDKDQFSVTAGNHLRDKKDDGEEQRSVSEVRFHPDFKFTTTNGINNDVALVKLSAPVKFTDKIRPVCLPESGEALPVGKTCVTAGWGRNNSEKKEHPEALQQLQVPVNDAHTCHGSWWWWNPAWGSTYVEDQMICAGPVQGDAGACQGDSGGMLVCQKEDNSWALYGVTSFAAIEKCVQLNKPSVFARVSSYVTWITKNMNEMTSL